MRPVSHRGTFHRRWAVIAALAALGATAGHLMAAVQTPAYRATSEVFVSFGAAPLDELHGSAFADELVDAYAALATTHVVLDPVIDDLRLPETARSLAATVTAESPENTVLIRISAVDPSPETAVRIADAVATELVEAARAGVAVPSPVGTVELVTVTPAADLPVPALPDLRVAMVWGVVAGGIVGAGLVIRRLARDGATPATA